LARLARAGVLDRLEELDLSFHRETGAGLVATLTAGVAAPRS